MNSQAAPFRASNCQLTPTELLPKPMQPPFFFFFRLPINILCEVCCVVCLLGISWLPAVRVPFHLSGNTYSPWSSAFVFLGTSVKSNAMGGMCKENL